MSRITAIILQRAYKLRMDLKSLGYLIFAIIIAILLVVTVAHYWDIISYVRAKFIYYIQTTGHITVSVCFIGHFGDYINLRYDSKR